MVRGTARTRVLVTVTVCTLAAPLASATSRSASDDAAASTTPSVAVSVAYADTHHGSSGQFPSPWLGAPGVSFVGTTSRWDAGAVRVDNPSTAAITGVNVTV